TSPLTTSSLQSTSAMSARGSISLMLASMRAPRTGKHQRKCVKLGLPTRILSTSAVLIARGPDVADHVLNFGARCGGSKLRFVSCDQRSGGVRDGRRSTIGHGDVPTH